MTRGRSTNNLQRMQEMEALAQNAVRTRNRSGDLQRMQQMQSVALDQANTFSVFCIGTSHKRDEPNNTFAALGACCTTPHFINDGPGTNHDTKAKNDIAGLVGWGMNDKLEDTMAAIKGAKRRPDVVVLTGHSRGAILCHMIAYALAEDPATCDMTVKMIVLDPVHQSKIRHKGAEEFHRNANLESYHSIIMENEDQGLTKLTPNFPFKFVQATEGQAKHMHYIPMPGSHGSGSQSMTHPVGEVTMHLIAAYMRARGVKFSMPTPTDLDMCELFAEIHVLNPRLNNGKRVVWNDSGYAHVHLGDGLKGKGSIQTERTDTWRHKALNKALAHNQQYGGHVPVQHHTFNFEYFFNEEHCYYFKKTFPFFYTILSGAPTRTIRNTPLYKRDFDLMMSRTALKATFPSMLYQEIEKLLL